MQVFYPYQLYIHALFLPYPAPWDYPTTQDTPSVYCILLFSCHSEENKTPIDLKHENNFAVGSFDVSFSF